MKEHQNDIWGVKNGVPKMKYESKLIKFTKAWAMCNNYMH